MFRLSSKILAIVPAVIFLLATPSAWADQHNAPSTSLTDVLSAYNAAAPGDTVFIPAGTSTWTSALTINKQVVIQGAGVGNTRINSSGNVFNIRAFGSMSRITAIEIDSGSQSVYLDGTVSNIRVDHCRFSGVTLPVGAQGRTTGVFDHNEFVNCKNAMFRLYGNNDPSATFPFAMGTADALFIEDNVFTVSTTAMDHIVESNSGSRYVVRHNTLNDTMATTGWRDTIDAHGYCEVAGRGSFTWEVYENTFNYPSADVGRIFHFRGGQGIMFNNTVNGRASWALGLTDYRGDSSNCTTCIGGCGVYPTGYPLKDQINHTYIWNNTIGGAPMRPYSDAANFVQAGRDYFETAPAGYVPFTYPHPLSAGVSANRPVPLPPDNVLVR